MKTEETGIERAVRFAKEPADAVKEFEAELKRFKQLFSVTPSGAIGWNLVCGDETSPATHAWFVANEMKLFWRAIRLAGPESVLFEVVDLEALDLLSDWVYETSKRPPELSPSRPDDSPNTVFTSPEDAQRISEGNSRAVGLFRRLQRSLREFSDAVSFKELLNDPRNDSPRGGAKTGSDPVEFSSYRQPTVWRNLRKQSGLADSTGTWTALRRYPTLKEHFRGEPGRESKSVAISRWLADQWHLELPEFTQEPAVKA